MRGLAVVTLAATVAGAAYLAFACVRLAAFGKAAGAALRSTRRDGREPAVTVLKPLCGDEPLLYQKLASFCAQDYENFQIIFGAADLADPALRVVARISDDFPGVDATLVVDSRTRYANRKISNVANMFEKAKHDLIIVADSDARVGPSYLRAIAAQFAQAQTGAVTCLYRGVPCGGLASDLGALFINDQFAPSVLVAQALGPIDFCFGATMAVTREALKAIGGFGRLGDALADDRLLGKLVHDAGYRVRLCPYVVENLVDEPSMEDLWFHEVRWHRTILRARPAGYAFWFVTYALPCAAAFWLCSGRRSSVWAVAAAGLLRLAVHFAARRALGITAVDRPWLIPLRDALGLAEWVAAFFARRVRWRGQSFSLAGGGISKFRSPSTS